MHRPYRAPELLFGAKTYDPKALDLWALGTIIAVMFGPPRLPQHNDEGEDEDDESDDEEAYRYDDPLEPPPPVDPAIPRRTLFDSALGDLGLAGSIFRLRGSPSPSTWPVRSLSSFP